MWERDFYVALNGKYLEDAERLLEAGDYSQASERLWGAVATALKAIAAERRWRRSSHYDLRQAIELYQETRDEDLLTAFSIANPCTRTSTRTSSVVTRFSCTPRAYGR